MGKVVDMNMFIALWRRMFAPKEPAWLTSPSDDPFFWGGLEAQDRRQAELARLVPDPRLRPIEEAPPAESAAAIFEMGAVAPIRDAIGIAPLSRSWDSPHDGHEGPADIRGRSRTPPAPKEEVWW